MHTSFGKENILAKQLVREVKRAIDTPSLMSALAGDRSLLQSVLRILNPTPGVDADFVKDVDQACRQENLSLVELKRRLEPAAAVLGISTRKDERSPDFYDILNVPSNAPDSIIKNAFRSQARQLHPDTNPGADSVDFVKLTEAYRVLSNPELRNQYDARRDKTSYWVEKDYEREKARQRKILMRRHRRRTLYQLGAVVMLLLATVFIADFFFKEQALMEPPRVAKVPVRLDQTLEKPALAEKPPALEEQSERAATSKTPLEVKQQTPPFQKVEEVVDVRNQARKAEVISLSSLPEAEKQAKPPVQPEPRVEPPEKETDPLPEKAETPNTPPKAENATPPLQKVENVVDVRNQARKAEVISIASIPGAQKKPESPVQPKPRVEPPVKPALPEKVVQQNVEPKPHPAPQRPAMQKPEEVVAAEPIEDSPASVAPKPERAASHSLERIETFLASYCGAYQDLDYDLFMAYFTADAMENDQPVKDLRPLYRRNFLNLRNLDYQIDVDHYVVRDEMIEVRGDYTLRWRFKKTGWKEREGPIFLSLVQVDEDYRVKRLVYR
jgi:hypothetical protein